MLYYNPHLNTHLQVYIYVNGLYINSSIIYIYIYIGRIHAHMYNIVYVYYTYAFI